jgi:hypothetical protein
MRIDHPAELGDGHFYPYLHDVDHDGKLDVLFGDWFGHVWFHRNLSTPQEKRFDAEGQKLETVDGAAIKVGPINGDTENSFQALQGARTTLIAGDYNGDGLDDLIVGDTYGMIRYYENVGQLKSPRFAKAVTVADLKSRLHVEKADWNRDGRLDVVASMSAHKIYVFLNEGSSGAVHFGDGIQLSCAIKGPIAMVTDLNRDGDEDLLINGAQGTSFVERSFIEHGYVQSRLLGIDTNSMDTKD